MVKSAIGYTRVSTKAQGASGLGLEAQRAAIEHSRPGKGLTISGWFTENESGKGSGTDALERRPALAAALKAAAKQGAFVVVAKLDRLSRDVHFISGLMAQGAVCRYRARHADQSFRAAPTGSVR